MSRENVAAKVRSLNVKTLALLNILAPTSTDVNSRFSIQFYGEEEFPVEKPLEAERFAFTIEDVVFTRSTPQVSSGKSSLTSKR